MTKNVYLIRHGLPDFPEGTRMCLGRTDLPLGAEGFRQAEVMAESLRGLPITMVFASTLTRAIQTAQALGQPVHPMEDLQELCAGEWDGLTFDEIKKRYPELYRIRGTDKTIPPPGAESDADGIRRFMRGMEAAAALAPGDFAVVAHGAIIRLFLMAIGQEGRKPGYTEIIHLQFSQGKFTLVEEEKHA